MRVRVIGALAVTAALAFPAVGQAAPSASVVDEVVAIVNDTVETWPVDPTGPIGGTDREWVVHSITITGTAGGISVVNTFPATEWSCADSQGISSYTVSCTAAVDKYTCYVMPVEAQSLGAGTSVNGTVTCGTNSLSTGYTTWPNPAVSTSATLGNAPVVVCQADYGDAISPLEPAYRRLEGVIVLPRDIRRDLDAMARFQVTCGPDPKV